MRHCADGASRPAGNCVDQPLVVCRQRGRDRDSPSESSPRHTVLVRPTDSADSAETSFSMVANMSLSTFAARLICDSGVDALGVQLRIGERKRRKRIRRPPDCTSACAMRSVARSRAAPESLGSTL